MYLKNILAIIFVTFLLSSCFTQEKVETDKPDTTPKDEVIKDEGEIVLKDSYIDVIKAEYEKQIDDISKEYEEEIRKIRDEADNICEEKLISEQEIANEALDEKLKQFQTENEVSYEKEIKDLLAECDNVVRQSFNDGKASCW